jgi:peptide/bleomycin uptake transporter
MFASFFPRPRMFLLSAVLWAALAILFWYKFGADLGSWLGFDLSPGTEGPVGVAVFLSPEFLWFYLYYVVVVALFAAGWILFSPHPWARWSILGSALILFVTYFQVQVSVAINGWYGPFYDLVQAALSKSKPVTLTQFFLQLATFAEMRL